MEIGSLKRGLTIAEERKQTKGLSGMIQAGLPLRVAPRPDKSVGKWSGTAHLTSGSLSRSDTIMLPATARVKQRG